MCVPRGTCPGAACAICGTHRPCWVQSVAGTARVAAAQMGTVRGQVIAAVQHPLEVQEGPRSPGERLPDRHQHGGCISCVWCRSRLRSGEPWTEGSHQDTFLTTRILSPMGTGKDLRVHYQCCCPSILIPRAVGIQPAASPGGLGRSGGHCQTTAMAGSELLHQPCCPSERTRGSTRPSLGPKTCVLESYLMYIYYNYLWLHLTNCSFNLMLFTLCCVKEAHNRKTSHQ